jgi:hypothetical protein
VFIECVTILDGENMAKSSIPVVSFAPTGGPVTIEVTSGYSTLGSFVLAATKRKEFNYVEFGKDPKSINDDIPDIFTIPINLAELSRYRVVILGKYRPAPGHDQIRVIYTFRQDGVKLHELPIEKKSDNPPEDFSHKFDFKEK